MCFPVHRISNCPIIQPFNPFIQNPQPLHFRCPNAADNTPKENNPHTSHLRLLILINLSPSHLALLIHRAFPILGRRWICLSPPLLFRLGKERFHVCAVEMGVQPRVHAVREICTALAAFDGVLGELLGYAFGGGGCFVQGGLQGHGWSGHWGRRCGCVALELRCV